MSRLYIFPLSLLLVLFLYALPASGDVPKGACCIAGGCSSDIDEYSCTTEGGTYQGDGTVCNDDTCSGNPVHQMSYQVNDPVCKQKVKSETHLHSENFGINK